MVKLQLNLPWKPILAWPWGVTYKIDPGTFLITEHQESWDIDAFEVSEHGDYFQCTHFRSLQTLYFDFFTPSM